MAGSLKLLNIVWADFIAVTMSLPDGFISAVQSPDLA
jgi:hypothetical protein